VTDDAVIRRLGEPGDLGWVVLAHGQVYAKEYGWNSEFEALVARIVADYAATSDPRREAAWIATIDETRVGCIFLVAKDDSTAQLRLRLVHPDGRGRRLGARLVRQRLRFAADTGYQRTVLWTNDPLADARRIYLAAGFRLTAQNAHHSFGFDLIGQTYELDLTGTA